MTSSPASTRARLADLALITYLGPIVQGRRVAVVGPASGEVARRARVLGASVVISFGGVGDDIAVRALTPGALAGMHGRLDVVVVPDAGAVPSLVAVLDEARRALGSDGVVVVASQPEDVTAPLEPGAKASVGYYDLEDLCATRFAKVRMLGRGPFLGYTLATLDEAGDDVALDTRLIDGDPAAPEAFVAVASDRDVTLDPLAVVQLPPEALRGVRASATRALEEELARQGQKLKEVEAASAERWVKIQRFEHGVKELEDENRKSRDKAVRLSKDLEDERKLRQRIELEVQMARRAPELPKTPDLEPEVKRLQGEVERLERALAAAKAGEIAAAARADEAAEALRAAEAERGSRESAHAEAIAEAGRALVAAKAAEAAVRARVEDLSRELGETRAARAAAQARVEDLSRELDETQAAEADLRGQLDEATERLERLDQTPRLRALEAEIEALRASAVVDGEYARLEQSLAAQAGALRKLQGERDTLEQSVRELALALAEARSGDLAEELAALRSKHAAAASVHAALVAQSEALAAENEILRERASRGTEEAGAKLQELAERAEALAAEADAARQQTAAERAEIARLHAQNIGLEARVEHAAMELEGARAGYVRRVAELERESERLLRALEVSGTQSDFDRAAALTALERAVAEARAERDGLAWRAREAEDAVTALHAQIAALRQEAVRLAARGAELEARGRNPLEDDDTALQSGPRIDALVADLSATAERLARTEEELAATRAASDERAAALEAELAFTHAETASRVARFEEALAAARREAGEAGQTRAADLRGDLEAALAAALSERDRKTTDVETLLAQLTDRDLRIAALERRREEELNAVQRSLTLESQANRTLRTSLDAVRSGLSAILVDGRGAMVAHDLMALLRRIEDA